MLHLQEEYGSDFPRETFRVLKNIRACALAYEKVTALAADYESHLSEWIEHLPLPIESDEVAVDHLLINLLREYLFQTA